MKAQLAQACWQALATKQPQDIALADLAEICDITPAQAVLHGGDVTNLLLHHMDGLEEQALAVSCDDFADDPHASIYEKILEGLIMRFEVLCPSRAQYDNLHKAAMRQPLLGAHCLHHLSHHIGKLITIAGDDSTGLIKQARIAGVVGVLLKVRSVWMEDDSTDLGLTMKALDQELKKACEWAVSLRLLRPDDLGSMREDK